MKKAELKTALRAIVSRCNVSQSESDVFEYVKSRFKKSAWNRFSEREKETIAAASAELHRENQALFSKVMRGV
jgi:hypothetical protein